MKALIAAFIVIAAPQFAFAQQYPEFNTMNQYNQNLKGWQQQRQNIYQQQQNYQQQQQINNNTYRITMVMLINLNSFISFKSGR